MSAHRARLASAVAACFASACTIPATHTRTTPEPVSTASAAVEADAPSESLAIAAATCGITDVLCAAGTDDRCLAAAAAPGGGLAFRYRHRDQWDDGGRQPLPHFVLNAARALRRAYVRAARGSSVERECGALLDSEVRYLRASLIDRDGALVWENEDGLAQAMEQAEWAHFFASLANAFEEKDRADEAASLRALALAMASALDRPIARGSGGVRSAARTCADPEGGPGPCVWFSSRGLGVPTEGSEPHWVLNQHLHAVLDSMHLYETLPASFEEARRAALERAAAGVRALAFGGWTSSDPQSPPSLEQLANHREAPPDVVEGGRYVWAHYEFDPSVGRATDISHERTCHYHAHTLQMIANIARWIEAPSHSEALSTTPGRGIVSAVSVLVAPGSIVHGWWRSESSASVRRHHGCPQPPLDPASIRDASYFVERFETGR